MGSHASAAGEQSPLPHVSRTALVPYRADAMYQLVADVEKYPGFLPWCASATVHERAAGEVEASLEVARGPIRRRFTTRNRLTAPSRIDVQLVDGPFRHLCGCWRFIALDESGCRVHLELDFELSNAVLRRLLGPLFDEIANTLVDAFCRRAVEVYGER